MGAGVINLGADLQEARAWSWGQDRQACCPWGRCNQSRGRPSGSRGRTRFHILLLASLILLGIQIRIQLGALEACLILILSQGIQILILLVAWGACLILILFQGIQSLTQAWWAWWASQSQTLRTRKAWLWLQQAQQ